MAPDLAADASEYLNKEKPARFRHLLQFSQIGYDRQSKYGPRGLNDVNFTVTAGGPTAGLAKRSSIVPQFSKNMWKLG